jgi:hypothetical protein
MVDPFGVVAGKRAATVLVAPSSGLLAIEKPDGNTTFTKPTALTEYTVCAEADAADAAMSSAAARIDLVFILGAFSFSCASELSQKPTFPSMDFSSGFCLSFYHSCIRNLFNYITPKLAQKAQIY